MYLDGVSAPASGRRLGHWTVAVPLLALLGWGIGFAIHQFGTRVERPLEVSPPPEMQIPPIVFPPRTHTLVGSVVAPDGTLVDDALVSLIAANEPHWTYTNARGEFRLEGLERGPWTLTVAATAHQPFTITFANESEPALVRLPDVAREMPKLEQRVNAPLTAQLHAGTEANFEGCEVRLVPTLPLEQIDAPFPRHALCDRSGRCEIADLQLGQYTVSVLPEWAQFGTWPDLTRGDDATPIVFDHRGDTHAPLAIEIVAGAVHGLVADRAGNPLEGALVIVASERLPERVWPPVRADARGSFTVPDLPPGRYVVTVSAGSGSNRTAVLVQARTVLELSLPPLSVERPR